jgi:hypothetical protein
MSSVYFNDLLYLKHSTYNFRQTYTVEVPLPSTDRYGKKSFRYAAAKLWNQLPDNFRQTSSFNHFRSLINTWQWDNCSCTSCWQRQAGCLKFLVTFVMYLSHHCACFNYLVSGASVCFYCDRFISIFLCAMYHLLYIHV